MTILFAMLYLNFALAILSALFLQSTAPLFHLMSCIQICKISIFNNGFSGFSCDVLSTLSNLPCEFL